MDTKKEVLEIKKDIDHNDRLGTLNRLSNDFLQLSVPEFRKLLQTTSAATANDRLGHLTFSEHNDVAGPHFDVTVTPKVDRTDIDFAIGSLKDAFLNIPDRGESQSAYVENRKGSSANILIKAYQR